MRKKYAKLAAALVVALCLFHAAAGPGPVDRTSADETIGRVAPERMRDGAGYYDAMAQALKDTNGPPKTGRAFRQPMVFEVWRVLPSEDAVWIAFTLLVAAAGLSIAATSDAPLAAP